ncbi:MAG: mechanosensitive ion channel domain-containing protein, partial [Pseudomonadota bacterium]|nr:mechanosensitive ion channel domain-containing protein [Pseudomonadota bacterium]
DTIEINGDEGKVIRLTSRATILLSYDGNHIRIPNATVFKSRIVNFTRNAERRFLFDVGVAPDSDLALALRLAEDSLAALPFTLQTPAPSVWIQEIGDSTVTLRMTAWIDQRESGLLAAKSESIRLILNRFTESGIAMPEPTYRVIDLATSSPDTVPDSAADSAKSPVAPPPAAPVEDDLRDVHAHDQDALSQMVAEERQETLGDDLLEKHAPSE